MQTPTTLSAYVLAGRRALVRRARICDVPRAAIDAFLALSGDSTPHAINGRCKVARNPSWGSVGYVMPRAANGDLRTIYLYARTRWTAGSCVRVVLILERSRAGDDIVFGHWIDGVDQLAPVARPGEAGFNDATGNGPAHPDNDEEVDPYLTEHGIEAPRA